MEQEALYQRRFNKTQGLGVTLRSKPSTFNLSTLPAPPTLPAFRPIPCRIARTRVLSKILGRRVRVYLLRFERDESKKKVIHRMCNELYSRHYALSVLEVRCVAIAQAGHVFQILLGKCVSVPRVRILSLSHHFRQDLDALFVKPICEQVAEGPHKRCS